MGLSPLLSFSRTSGANPTAAGARGGQQVLWHLWGGTVGAGTVFAMTAEGALTAVFVYRGRRRLSVG
jgi:hypothetical protein